MKKVQNIKNKNNYIIKYTKEIEIIKNSEKYEFRKKLKQTKILKNNSVMEN